MRHRALARLELDRRAGDDELAPIDAGVAQQLEEHRLVGKDVRGITIDVVEREERVIEEGGWTGTREHVRRVDPLDVLAGTRHLVHALLPGEARLEVGRKVVRDRVPDRAGELHDLRVERTEGAQGVGITRAGVVLVQHTSAAVVENDERIAERAVGRARECEDRRRETVEVDGLGGAGRHEVLEADGAQLAFEEGHAELGQQHPRVLVDVAGQPGRVEVVEVQVRDVEEVGRRESLRIETVVTREGKPRAEIRRREPRIAQHRAAAGLHEEPDVAEEGHPHRGHSCQFRGQDPIPATNSEPARHEFRRVRREFLRSTTRRGSIVSAPRSSRSDPHSALDSGPVGTPDGTLFRTARPREKSAEAYV